MKPGPKPRPGPRENNGRLKRDNRKPEVRVEATKELLDRRAEVVPFALRETQDAGKALGILYCRADITWAQKEAGEKLRASWIRWRSLQGIPPRTQTTRGKASSYDPEWTQLDEARQEYEERLKVCMDAGRQYTLIRAILEALCFEDIVPPRVYEIGTVPSLIRENIRKSLAALATHLGIQERV